MDQLPAYRCAPFVHASGDPGRRPNKTSKVHGRHAGSVPLRSPKLAEAARRRQCPDPAGARLELARQRPHADRPSNSLPQSNAEIGGAVHRSPISRRAGRAFSCRASAGVAGEHGRVRRQRPMTLRRVHAVDEWLTFARPHAGARRAYRHDAIRHQKPPGNIDARACHLPSTAWRFRTVRHVHTLDSFEDTAKTGPRPAAETPTRRRGSPRRRTSTACRACPLAVTGAVAEIEGPARCGWITA